MVGTTDKVGAVDHEEREAVAAAAAAAAASQSDSGGYSGQSHTTGVGPGSWRNLKVA